MPEAPQKNDKHCLVTKPLFVNAKAMLSTHFLPSKYYNYRQYYGTTGCILIDSIEKKSSHQIHANYCV